MSILFSNDIGTVVSHKHILEKFIRTVKNDDGAQFVTKHDFFCIRHPFKERKKRNKVRQTTKDAFAEIINNAYQGMKPNIVRSLSPETTSTDFITDPKLAADEYYCKASSRKINKAVGGNNSKNGIVVKIANEPYFIPPYSYFFNCDVSEMSLHIEKQFDVIVLDPPWWNKYIRRKRSHNADDAYKMMNNDDLGSLPIDAYLKNDGLIVVWVTNAPSHIEALKNVIFPRWKVNYVGTWAWLKVTTQGELVTPFSNSGGKQPFERIMFAARADRQLPLPQDGKLVVSIPSAIHSHKPPLCELLAPFLPENPDCLEIFARSLIPYWTSYGNEVLMLQHMSFYSQISKSEMEKKSDEAKRYSLTNACSESS